MQIQTAASGQIDINPDKIIRFPQGLVGMSKCTQWVILEPVQDTCFHWLQSVDKPELMLVVTDPSRFVPDYQVPLTQAQREELQLHSVSDAQVLVTVNQQGNFLTGNLRGPLVINIRTKTGQQLVLDQNYSTRQTLVELRHVPQSLAA